MLYYLFDYLAETGVPGSRLMNYITFRSGAAFVLALFIAMVFGRRIIDRLQLMLLTTVWLGALGFADDWLKMKRHNKDGMSGKFKIVGQVGLGLIVGCTMWMSPDIVMRENVETVEPRGEEITVTYRNENVKAAQTTIPFVKNNNFDYAAIMPPQPDG